jgi:hypothetical protein
MRFLSYYIFSTGLNGVAEEDGQEGCERPTDAEAELAGIGSLSQPLKKSSAGITIKNEREKRTLKL